VSHINDAKRLAEYERLLGEPRSLTRAAQVGGRRPLDTSSPGQQEFQALLFWCLFSPPRSLRWDAKGGRSFRAMQDYYSWVSPQQRYLATGWTVPARVASYLLPDFKSERDIPGGALRFSGIPGLRVAGFTKQAICLKHLPTGGVLQLYGRGIAESRAVKAQDLDSEAGYHRAKTRTELTLPLWKSEKISQEEDEGLADWSLAPHAPVLSAVMARMHAITNYNTGAELDVNPLNGCPRLSWWGKPSLKSFVALLTRDDLMKVNGAKSLPVGHNSHTLYIDDAALELRGPVGDD
jgi:hypothetical protein